MCCTITKLPNRTRRQTTDFLLTAGEILPPPHIVLTFWHPDLDLLILGIGFVSSMYTCTFTSADLQMIVFWPPSKYNLCAYTHYWSRNYTDSSRAKNKCTIYRFPHSARWPIQPTTHAAKADEYLFCSEINVPSTSKMIKIIQSRLHISIYKLYLLERKRNLAKTDFFFQIHVSKNLILDIYSLSKTRLRLYF